MRFRLEEQYEKIKHFRGRTLWMNNGQPTTSFFDFMRTALAFKVSSVMNREPPQLQDAFDFFASVSSDLRPNGEVVQDCAHHFGPLPGASFQMFPSYLSMIHSSLSHTSFFKTILKFSKLFLSILFCCFQKHLCQPSFFKNDVCFIQYSWCCIS